MLFRALSIAIGTGAVVYAVLFLLSRKERRDAGRHSAKVGIASAIGAAVAIAIVVLERL